MNKNKEVVLIMLSLIAISVYFICCLVEHNNKQRWDKESELYIQGYLDGVEDTLDSSCDISVFKK